VNCLAEDWIERIYRKNDYNIFKDNCREVPVYLDRLIEVSNSICKETLLYNMIDDPSIELRFYFEKFTEESLEIEYISLLKISKVSDLFVFQHEFSVENKDPERIAPSLDGYSGEAYNFAQYKVENVITDFLINHNMQKLQLSEMDEVITDIDIKEETIFGPQMTLENALFRDLYGICDS